MIFVAAPAAAHETATVATTCSSEGKLTTIQRAGQPIEEVGDPIDEQVIARALPDKHTEVTLTNSLETPYRCIGGFIYSLQRLGYTRIGFISEPPSAK